MREKTTHGRKESLGSKNLGKKESSPISTRSLARLFSKDPKDEQLKSSLKKAENMDGPASEMKKSFGRT